jgi:hypothetical protein
LRLTSAGLAVLFLVTNAGATPITLTFSGTATGSVDNSSFMNQPFSIIFTSDTNDICQIGQSPCPLSGDVGDYTTPEPTMNSFTIGTIVTSPENAELTGLTTSMGILGPAVFLNPTKNNVGIWFYNTADWLTTASSAYTSSFGLVNNLSVSNVQAFANGQLGSTPMESTVGAVNFTSLSNVSFTESLGAPSGPSGASGPTGSGSPGGSIAGAVPEPNTLMMFAIGAAGVLIGKLRRRA